MDPEESVDLNESVDLDKSCGSECVLWILSSLVELNESVDFLWQFARLFTWGFRLRLPLCFSSVIQTEFRVW